jgi:hypothetical protein
MDLSKVDIIACGTKGSSITSYEHAVVKYNNGNGVLLCNECYNIIRLGFGHVDARHYCDKCKENRMSLLAKVREIEKIRDAD